MEKNRLAKELPMAGLPAPNGAGGMEWFHLVCGTSGVEMREPMACGTFIRERLPGCKASIPCTFDSIFHFLLIFFSIPSPKINICSSY